MWRAFYELESLGCALLGWSNFDLFSRSSKKKLSFHCDSLLITLVLRTGLFLRLGIAWLCWRCYTILRVSVGLNSQNLQSFGKKMKVLKPCVSSFKKRQPKKFFYSQFIMWRVFAVLSRSRWTLFQALFFVSLFVFVFLEQVKTDGNFFKTTDFFLQVSVKHNGQKFIWKNR